MYKTWLLISFFLFLQCKTNSQAIYQKQQDNKSYICYKGQAFSIKFPQAKYKLINAPKGMRFYPNGLLTWTPTNNQGGKWHIEMEDLQSKKLKALDILVKGQDIVYNGIFVDFMYEGHENGTPKEPFSAIKNAIKFLKKQNSSTPIIYIRGGSYHQKNYGQNLNNKSFIFIKNYHGKANRPLTITAWGNEHVTLKSDGQSAFTIHKSDNMIIKNLEFEGVAQKIKLKEVINNWWQTPKFYKGSGLSLNHDCHDILISGCVIHDFPGAGIAVHNSDAIKINRNILYNNAWWSISGTGGAILNGSKNLSENNSEIAGNLFLNIESRVISRVFSKGFASMVVDEGEALLVQEYKDNGFGYDYQKPYEVYDNYLAYNGKGITVNKASHVRIQHNAMYYSKYFRVGSISQDVLISQNAVEVSKGTPWLSVSHQKTTGVKVMNNFYTKGATVKYSANKDIYLTKNIALEKVFNNWHQPVNMVRKNKAGPSAESWVPIGQLVNLYALQPKPLKKTLTKQEIEKMADQIIAVALQKFPGIHLKCIRSSQKQIKIVLENLPESFVKKNNLPGKNFNLIFKHGYHGRFCQ